MDAGPIILVVAIALVVVVLTVYAIVRARSARLGDIDADQVPELLRAERRRPRSR